MNHVQIVKHRRTLIVLDIDGCLVDSFDRLPHLLQGDRATYDNLYHTDKVIPAGYLVYSMFLDTAVDNPAMKCLFITSRSECARGYTTNQLQALFGLDFPVDQRTLLMRPVGENNTPDAELKPRLLAEAGYTPDDVLLVVEDSASMTAHWRSLGVTVWQTLPDATKAWQPIPDLSEASK